MKILLIDDDEIALSVMTAMLVREGYSVKQFTDAETAYQYLKESESPNIVVVDWMLEHMSGINFCELVRNTDILFQPYLIVVTSRTQQDDEAVALRHGADDFITKPVNAAIFQARVRVGERIISYQKQLQLALKEMTQHATFDSLTTLLNRFSGEVSFAREVEMMRRQDVTLSIAMLDIDHFKDVNDQWGHTVGDAVLRQLAMRLKEVVRKSDLIYRHGGEEFLMVMNDDNESIEGLLERLRTTVSELPFRVGDINVPLSVSIGAVRLNSDAIELLPKRTSEQWVEVLVHLADQQLYRAKQAGRNRIEFGDFMQLSGGGEEILLPDLKDNK